MRSRRAFSRAWAGGNGADGQLGYGGTENRLTPAALDFFRGRNVRGVASGSRHTLVLAENGAVYSFGNNDHGQLGHSKRQLRPETIDYLEAFRIVQVACGSRHSLAVTDDGQVLGWGASDRGQTGQGAPSITAAASSKPRFIKGLQSRRIVQVSGGDARRHEPAGDEDADGDGDLTAGQVASGDAHNLALSETGAVFAWGDNSQGGHARWDARWDARWHERWEARWDARWARAVGTRGGHARWDRHGRVQVCHRDALTRATSLFSMTLSTQANSVSERSIWSIRRNGSRRCMGIQSSRSPVEVRALVVWPPLDALRPSCSLFWSTSTMQERTRWR